MSSMSDKLKAKLAKAKAVGPDMNEATKGGGYTPPEAGKNCRLRFIGFYEGGTHVEQTGQYAGKKNKKVKMDFELSGGKGGCWDPVEVDGKMIPKRLSLGGPFGMNYSLNEKAGFFKLFKLMSDCHPDVNATIMAELLGKEFLCDIEHTKSKDGKKTYANIVNIRKAERENDDGDIVPVKVAEPLTEPKFFIHDIADREMWDALFIDGKYDDEKDKEGNVTRAGRTKNVIQEWIMSAIDFDSSPIGLLLKAGGSQKDNDDLDQAIAGANDTEPHIPDDEEQQEQVAPATPDMSEMV